MSAYFTCEPDMMKVLMVALSDSGAHLDQLLKVMDSRISYLASMLVMQGKVTASHSPMRTRTITRT